MIRGIIASLIASIVFFVLGELSVEVLGTRSLGEGEFEDMKLFEDAPEMSELVAEYKFVGERTWEFDAAETLGIISRKANTKVKKIDGDKITLTVKTDGAKNAAVAVSASENGEFLGISVSENGGLAFWNGASTKVEIGLPDKVLAGLEIQLGSGELKAADIKAAAQFIDVGSGKMEYTHAADYEARELTVDLHSGIFSASGIKAEKAELDIGSGVMNYEQAADFEAAAITVDLSSGKFSGSEIKAANTVLEIGSGVLEFAQGKDFKGETLSVDIGSGSVTVTNADTSAYEISMGSGSLNISGLTGTGEINVGSGSCSADFAATDPRGSSIDLSSGSLKVYLPKGAGAQIEADVSSGSVSYDCCGASGKLKDGQSVTLGNGGAKFTVDVSSGKVSFLDSKKYTAEPVRIDQVTITDNQ
ncbi:MAG: DUF4097 domain-containing protein [Oscillospiraceae bacterium]|nr:DUF4097 domain-containing protein [Oscillospiraceae bacterium]